jgi:hypothetical protein
MSYAKTGPPFDFLGNFQESQKNVLASWVADRTANFPAIQLHHQVRAQQLRKTAGMLEAYYATVDHGNIEPLAAGFQKEVWQPGQYGHWAYAFRNDHLPAMAMVEVKKRFRYQMERQDEAVFHMKHLRNQIEVQEDKAQHANESPDAVKKLMDKIEVFFGLPEYQAALVKDISNPYKGEPLFRVNQLDPPTRWELEQHNHGTPTSTITVKG